MGPRILAYVLLGCIAGAVAFTVYEASYWLSAAVAFTAVAWILFRFTSAGLLWDTGKFLINPYTMFLLMLGLGMTYLALDFSMAGDSVLGGIAIGFLGAAAGMFLFKYWNIGG